MAWAWHWYANKFIIKAFLNKIFFMQLSEDNISSFKATAMPPRAQSTAATSNMIHHSKPNAAVFGQSSSSTQNSAHKNNEKTPHSVLLMDAFNPPSEGII